MSSGQGTRLAIAKRHSDVKASKRTFTRAKALKALAGGADPTETRFMEHKNYHVVDRARHLTNDRIGQ